MLCRVDKLSSTITSFNVKRKEKKRKKNIKRNLNVDTLFSYHIKTYFHLTV